MDTNSLFTQNAAKRIGLGAGKVASAIAPFTWVRDALTVPSDLPPKGFEFVPTQDQAELRPRTNGEVTQESALAAIAAGSGMALLSKDYMAGVGAGELTKLGMEGYLKSTPTHANHFLTQEDLDRITGDSPSLP